MAVNQMLTVRIPEKDLEKLDQLAAVQGRPRSQLVHSRSWVRKVERASEIRHRWAV